MSDSSLPGRAAVAACLAALLYLAVFPLQDYDTFWHLAYGRAMAERGAFINHEIFSYTAAGAYLGSHSQLAQVLLYAAWAAGGATALLGLKLLLIVAAFALVVATARLFGAPAPLGAALALAAFTAGLARLVERPELFSIVLQALLIWLLFRARSRGYVGRELWAVPPLMVVWDYLHGSVYGLAVLAAFVGAETVRLNFLPGRWGGGRPEDPPGRLGRLLAWSGVTVAAMLLHPNGLLNYAYFWRVGVSDEFRMYGEFTPPTSAQFAPFWVVGALLAVLLLLRARRCDLTTLALLIPFAVLALNFNRAILAFCLAAIPAVAQMLAPRPDGRLTARWWPAPAALVLLVVAVLVYKQHFVIANFRFGTGIDGNTFPVGSARFVREQALSGNLYNMNGFGGYLAFFLAPQQKIFHYNQPGVFTALFDYLHKPASRREWPIDYAIIGDALELNMFQREGFVTVYHEPTAAVMVRNDVRYAALIERYRVRFFGPLMTDAELLARGRTPLAAVFLREVSDYLTYREDVRVAGVLTRLLRESAAVRTDRERLALLEPALRGNPDSAALLALRGEILRKGEQ